ncbi:DUF4893 domain-containing protein [Parasphingorhabdus sp.]|uniref:DUF4893 domain-containing protein n=1 Tax=Parasphingorhabdus sp. TaxID=2709688 RepID=UPI0035948141
MIAGLLLLAAAAGEPQADSGWRERATAFDVDRLERWEEALEIGRSGVIAAGKGAVLAARSPLFEKDAALASSDIPPGLYHCSITKLDSDAEGELAYVAYAPFKCRVVDQNGRKHFTKLTGSQRTIGWIDQASGDHSVYLGTLIYHYEDALVPYGETVQRDQAAVVHHIGPDRWRMIFPFPAYESKVDVMELTPAQ